MTKTCQCCGREFTTANGKQIYCSRKCTDKIYYLRKIGRLEKFVKIIEKPPKQRECTNWMIADFNTGKNLIQKFLCGVATLKLKLLRI